MSEQPFAQHPDPDFWELPKSAPVRHAPPVDEDSAPSPVSDVAVSPATAAAQALSDEDKQREREAKYRELFG